MGQADETEWFDANRGNWDARVPVHMASPFYDVVGFLAGRDTLQPFERDELGDVAGLDIVHLQCHFGLDTLSLARLGARVTGLDFSAPAIEAARVLAERASLEAEFAVANVYDAARAVGGRQFDVVYVGIGSLVWLPDVHAWASVVRDLLKPGGRLYLVDGHPLSEVLADESLEVVNDYFGDEPQRWDSPGTYADASATLSASVTYQWAHPVGEIIGAILEAGLRLDFFRELDYALFPRWPFLVRAGDGTYRMPEGRPSVPMMFTLGATKA